MITKNRGKQSFKKRQGEPREAAVSYDNHERKNTICANASCRLRRAGCSGFEGCPGYKGK